MTKMHSYKVTLRVQNQAGVLARVTILLRKFQINIRKIHVEPIDDTEQFSDMEMVLQCSHEKMPIVLAKIETLIPVIKVTTQKVKCIESMEPVEA